MILKCIVIARLSFVLGELQKRQSLKVEPKPSRLKSSQNDNLDRERLEVQVTPPGLGRAIITLLQHMCDGALPARM